MSIKEDFFGKDYFNSGKHIPGAFKYYTFEDNYPSFKTICYLIKKYFNPKRVLDVGCAKGFLVYTFREMGIEAFGVDISGYAISCAPMDVQPYLYKVDLDKDSLPFEDDYFDFITFLGTIEYLRNHGHAIHEIKRVLVGGVFVVNHYL